MELLESLDDLREELGGLGEGEDPVLLLGLQVNEVSTVAVFEEHIVEVLVFMDMVELGHVFASHVLHALDLSLEVDDHVFVLA